VPQSFLPITAVYSIAFPVEEIGRFDWPRGAFCALCIAFDVCNIRQALTVTKDKHGDFRHTKCQRPAFVDGEE
jgi:hypothetical protein